MRYRLIHADRTIEDDPLARVGAGPGERGAAQSHRLCGNQNALRIEAVQDIAEPATLLTDPIGHWHPQAFDEELVRVDCPAPHLVDLMHRDMAAVEVHIEKAQTVAAAALRKRGGARKEQHLCGMLCGGNPDLLPIDHIVVSHPPRQRGELEGVEPGVRFGHRKAGFLLPADQGR